MEAVTSKEVISCLLAELSEGCGNYVHDKTGKVSAGEPGFVLNKVVKGKVQRRG